MWNKTMLRHISLSISSHFLSLHFLPFSLCSSLPFSERRSHVPTICATLPHSVSYMTLCIMEMKWNDQFGFLSNSCWRSGFSTSSGSLLLSAITIIAGVFSSISSSRFHKASLQTGGRHLWNWQDCPFTCLVSEWVPSSTTSWGLVLVC